MQALTVQFANEEIESGSYAELSPLQEWELSACPLSTNDIGVDSESQQWLAVAEPFIKTRQKNPAIAVNAAGERLIVWGEAISHPRGGRLNMHLVGTDGSDRSTEFDEEIEIPDFSFPAAAQLPDGNFLVLY